MNDTLRKDPDMKIVLLTLLLIAAAVVLTGCNEEQALTTWSMTSQETNYTGMVGYKIDNTEVGAIVQYPGNVDFDDPDLLGCYLTWHLTQVVSIEDTPRHSPVKDLVESLIAVPYVRLEILAGLDGGKIGSMQPNWAAGSTFRLSADSPWAVVAEYYDGDAVVDEEMRVGIHAEYPF